MPHTIAVYDGERLTGYFDLSNAKSLCESGSSPDEVNEAGAGFWTELLQLPDGKLVFLERQLTYGNARLTDQAAADVWMAHHDIWPPDDYFAELQLTDSPTVASESRCRRVTLPEALTRLGKISEDTFRRHWQPVFTPLRASGATQGRGHKRMVYSDELRIAIVDGRDGVLAYRKRKGRLKATV